MNSLLALASSLTVGKFLHFWPYLWNKSWNGASVTFLALIGGVVVGLAVLVICGTFNSSNYIQVWFQKTEKELASDPEWRRSGFTEAARKLWEPTQPTIDEGLNRLDLKNTADWELLINAQHRAAKTALQDDKYRASFVAEPAEIETPRAPLAPPISYPITIGPDNLWTGQILKSVISAYQKEATEAGIQLAKKARLAASGATLCLIPMIMIALAVAADRDILVH